MNLSLKKIYLRTNVQGVQHYKEIVTLLWLIWEKALWSSFLLRGFNK